MNWAGFQAPPRKGKIMKLKRLCDMISLECAYCPYEGLSEPEFCPCFSSEKVAIEAMATLDCKVSAVTQKLLFSKTNEEG